MQTLRSLAFAFAVGVAVFIGCLESARAAPADLQFNQVVNDFVFGTLALSPTTATGIGYHRHHGAVLDEKLEDFSPAGIKASLNLLSDIETRIGTLDAKSFNAEQRADIDIMHDAIEAARLDMQDIQSYRHNPTMYVELIGNALYTPYVLHYAAADERFKHIIKRLSLIPALIRQAEENLQDAPEIWNKVAREENAGNIDLIDGALRANCPAPLLNDYSKAAAPALDALRGFNIWLDTALSKKTADWRLGKKRYAKKFSFVLAPGKTPEALLKEAEADLAKTRDEMVQLAAPKTVEQALADVAIHHATPATYIPSARQALATATAFVKARDLVTLP
ncbi:MAG: DUF885 domain-containing protein, partial [Pseudomonadota bacterium]|nr:DUF885 domain-containing protein [Pseudomonadota bacterium]